jgi:hypothetical protein
LAAETDSPRQLLLAFNGGNSARCRPGKPLFPGIA